MKPTTKLTALLSLVRFWDTSSISKKINHNSIQFENKLKKQFHLQWHSGKEILRGKSDKRHARPVH